MKDVVPCVKVDTTDRPSADYRMYVETTVSAASLKPMRCEVSEVAKMCGLDLKVYFKKGSPGWRQCHRGLGPPPDLSTNNGAATFLLVSPGDGLAEWIVGSEAYVVLGDGEPITRGQVWGIQEMVNCAMDIYDITPENQRRGREAHIKWAEQYKQRKWTPRSGTGGVAIYP